MHGCTSIFLFDKYSSICSFLVVLRTSLFFFLSFIFYLAIALSVLRYLKTFLQTVTIIIVHRIDVLLWDSVWFFRVEAILCCIWYYTIIVFCWGQYEFLWTLKRYSPNPLGWGQYWFLRSIKTRIDRYKRL